MANIVKSLTEANIKKFGIKREADKDFTDDGNRFRGFSYKGIMMSQCRSEGETYLSVRIDYDNYDFHYDEWFDSEEHKLADEFNGVSEVNVDKLIENIEKIIIRVEALDKHAKKNVNKFDMTEVIEEAQWEIANAEAVIENAKKVEFWKMENHDLSQICTAINSVEKAITFIKECDFSKLSYKQKYDYTERVKKGMAIHHALSMNQEYSYVNRIESIIEKYTK